MSCFHYFECKWYCCGSPSLTWRDVQHLIVQTSKRHNIDDDFEKQPWQINGAGFNGTLSFELFSIKLFISTGDKKRIQKKLILQNISSSLALCKTLPCLFFLMSYVSESDCWFWNDGCRSNGIPRKDMGPSRPTTVLFLWNKER